MEPWFGPKRIGWGARPVTWQGWLVTVAYLGGIAAVVLLLRGTDPTLLVATVVALTAIYLLIIWVTYGD